MKVKELIKQLQELDGELEVITSADAEGNSFSVVQELENRHYTGKNWTDTETYSRESWDDWKDGEAYPGDNCVVLWT